MMAFRYYSLSLSLFQLCLLCYSLRRERPDKLPPPTTSKVIYINPANLILKKKKHLNVVAVAKEMDETKERTGRTLGILMTHFLLNCH